MQEPEQIQASEQTPGKPSVKKHIWVLTIVTYVLVFGLTYFAWWSYHYFDDKVHREQHAGKPLDPIHGTR